MFTALVGCAHPLQLAGMGGAGTVDLAVAVSRAGGLGMLSGVGGAAVLAGQLDAVPDDVVIGVNFLAPFLDPAALDLASRRARVVELFWAEPDADLVAQAKAGGALAAWQVGSSEEAALAVGAGCDFVVVQGVEAGGHVRGTTPLLELLPEVRRRVGADVVLVGAGGIGTAGDVAAAFAGGADAVRIGTRFVAAVESDAHPGYVDALLRASAEDTVLTTAFGEGWPDAPHRVLRSSVDAGEANGPGQRWTPNWPTAAHAGPIEAMALYAGTSVGAVTKRQSAAEIVAELLDLALTSVARRRRMFGLDVRFWSLHSWTWDDRLADAAITDRITELTGWLRETVDGDGDRPAPARFVDIGCGTGNHVRSLAGQHAGADVVGVDFARGMLAKAVAKATPSTTFVRADLCDGLPLRAAAFDGALSVYAAQFFDLAEFAAEARRVLRPGGVLVLELPRPDASRPVQRQLSLRHGLFQRLNRTAAVVGERVGVVHVIPPQDVDAALARARFTVVAHRDTERSLAVLARSTISG